MALKFSIRPDLNKKVELIASDITKLKIDAVTNAANETLLGGGGVDGAIHAAAGPGLLKECRGLNGCKTGQAKITKGYNLSAKHVIHTVGPIGMKPEKLRACYINSLEVAKQNKVKSIAFPCISTGIYGYPNKNAAHVALKAVREWLEKNDCCVNLIQFCLFLPIDKRIYKQLLLEYFPRSPQESSVDGAEQSKPDTEDSEGLDSTPGKPPIDISEEVESKQESDSMMDVDQTDAVEEIETVADIIEKKISPESDNAEDAKPDSDNIETKSTEMVDTAINVSSNVAEPVTEGANAALINNAKPATVASEIKHDNNGDKDILQPSQNNESKVNGK